MKTFIIAAVLSLILPPIHAFSQTPSSAPTSFSKAPLDFDGDGMSDHVTLETQNDGSANEKVFRIYYSASDGSSADENFEYGKSEDILAPGHYDGDSIADIAVVRENDEDETLDWRIKSSESEAIEIRQFGSPGNMVVAGLDFDNDGNTELAILDGLTLHYIQSSDDEQISKTLPLNDEIEIRAFGLGDMNGDGNNDLIALASGFKLEKSEIKAICSSRPKGTKRRRCRRVQKKRAANLQIFQIDITPDNPELLSRKAAKQAILAGAIPDLDNDGDEELVYVRNINRHAKRAIVDTGDQKIPVHLPGVKDVSMGDYSGAGLSIGVLTKSDELLEVDPGTLEVSTAKQGVQGEELVKPINFGLSAAGSLPDGRCDSTAEFSGGNLWKQTQDHNPGYGVTLLAPSYNGQIRSVSLFTASGRKVTDSLFTGYANGNRSHWRWNSMRVSQMPKNLIMRAVRNNGNTICFSVPDPTRRYD